ncbi:UNVERIFIED_CONTAM: SNF1-related protein kinase regulatory subunit beta-2 [Sesamum latifolium]|uniref:SNF1-related protein kinase regulatory subunit beta-2 n=1 Tax=Sesamum latifolium TaxID=2727402 RepID=A0AAW2WA88_9LAMI
MADQDVVQGGGEYMGQSPPPSPRASQSPLMFRPQTSLGYEDMYDEQGVPTMITWSYGGKDVAVEGSWDDWKSRFLVDGQRVIQPPAPRSATQAAPTRRRPSTLQSLEPRTATQQQVGYFGPRNEALLRDVGSASTQASYSILANKRYNKRPTIDQVLEKMKERSKRRQQE